MPEARIMETLLPFLPPSSHGFFLSLCLRCVLYQNHSLSKDPRYQMEGPIHLTSVYFDFIYRSCIFSIRSHSQEVRITSYTCLLGLGICSPAHSSSHCGLMVLRVGMATGSANSLPSLLFHQPCGWESFSVRANI